MHNNSKFNHTEIKNLKKQKLNVSEPSVDNLESGLKISGHEMQKNINLKLNVSEPSVDILESEIRVSGHENDIELSNKKLNISEPSVKELENKIKVSGHKLEAFKRQNISNMEPSLGQLEEKLVHGISGFNHNKNKPTGKMHLTSLEPSVDFLEAQLKVEHDTKLDKNETKIFLPGYEGFHGIIEHDNEAFQHDGNKSDHLSSVKPADIDDFKNWLENQSKVSKIGRFKRLHEEFSNLNRRMDDHDFGPESDKSKVDEKDPGVKLEKAIRELEEAEKISNGRKPKLDL